MQRPEYHGFDRRVYNAFIHTKNKAFRREETKTFNRKFTNFDVYPTLLSAAGFNIIGDALGIGINMFSDKQTLLEKYGLDTIEAEGSGVTQWYQSHFMSSMHVINEPNIVVTLRPMKNDNKRY